MVFDVSTNELIEKAAVELKKELDMPSWAHFAKTGNHKERPPVDDDWWYIRAAAILRTVYLRGPVGVSKLRTKYGGNKNRGVKPNKFVRGSGSVARKILQQLEAAGYVKEQKKDKRKGRVITPKGVSLLFTTSKKLSAAKPKPKALAPKVEAKAEEVKAEAKEVAPVKTEAKEVVETKTEAKEVVKQDATPKEVAPIKKEVKEVVETKTETKEVVKKETPAEEVKEAKK